METSGPVTICGGSWDHGGSEVVSLLVWAFHYYEELTGGCDA